MIPGVTFVVVTTSTRVDEVERGGSGLGPSTGPLSRGSVGLTTLFVSSTGPS